MSRRFLKNVLFLLPVVILIPYMASFPFGRGQVYSDMLISHYPNALYLQRSISEGGTIPLWSPLILGGYPFAANPLSGLFYLPSWIALLFPLPFGLNLLVVLHLLWAGIGMYFLLSREGLSEIPALFGALAFEGLPKVFSHLGAGHLTLIYAVAWTPWLLFTERRFARARTMRWLVPGAVLGMIVLADVRWAAYSGIFWLTYSAWIRWKENIRQESEFSKTAWTEWALHVFGKIAFALILAAPLLLPMAQHVLLSTRGMLTVADSLYLSLPPGNLIGLVYPAIGGSAEWITYAGGVVLVLTLQSVAQSQARKHAIFWLAWIPVTLLFALGSYLPFMPAIANLPGMSLLRVPPRIVFLTGMCLSAAAAYSLDAVLMGSKSSISEKPGRFGIFLFAVTAFISLLALAVWITMRDPSQRTLRFQFAWGAVVFLASTILIFAARAKRISGLLAAVSLLALTLVDVACLNRISLEFRTPQAVFSEVDRIAQYLKNSDDKGPFRIYSPSYSLPQHAGAYYGFEQVDGVDPLQLSSYTHFMEAASGVSNAGYSVTLPPFASGNPLTDNKDALPNTRLLGLLSVRYVVSAFPLRSENLDLVQRIADVFIYENRDYLPRAWVQDHKASIGNGLISYPEVDLLPNRVRINAEGPGLLVLSEIAYPGWRVTVDGTPAAVETVDGILRGVALDAGPHRIIFSFQPILVYMGILLSAAALLAWVLALIKPWRRIA